MYSDTETLVRSLSIFNLASLSPGIHAVVTWHLHFVKSGISPLLPVDMLFSSLILYRKATQKTLARHQFSSDF